MIELVRRAFFGLLMAAGLLGGVGIPADAIEGDPTAAFGQATLTYDSRLDVFTDAAVATADAGGTIVGQVLDASNASYAIGHIYDPSGRFVAPKSHIRGYDSCWALDEC